ncbi:MAG: hypothetical protein CMI09_07400 [Oceanospirillaceae bacterium]|nr:hypothetical protein [Oceanospirillaceae bacterium]
MTNEQVSSKTLWQATAGAVLVGAIALVTLIMPAEYNVDPTGIGSVLGLTALSPEGLAEAKEAANATSQNSAQSGGEGNSMSTSMNDVAQLALPPNSGLEYKMIMEKGAQLSFEWMTDGALVYVDMHGEPAGDTSGYFLSYAETTVNMMKGSFTAAFTGTHGWYFKNTTDQPVKIQLFFNGQYQDPHVM